MQKTGTLIKKEAVLICAVVLAAASMLFVAPSAHYLRYFDLPMLGVLLCLMLTVAGFVKLGMLDLLAEKLIARCRSTRGLIIILVNCVFFVSLLFTNDVALIIFIPLTIGILHRVCRRKLIFTIVLQTIAANLGSMLTPIGNPQNLYLYSHYGLRILNFLKTVAPIVGLSWLIIMGILLVSKAHPIESVAPGLSSLKGQGLRLAYFICLFVLCVLTVLRIVDYRVCVALVVVSVLLVDRRLFAKVDWGLLLTFVFLFIFVGNLEQIPAVKDLLVSLLSGRVLLISVVSSQVISNVPAAMLISRFTNDARSVLLGTNIGGLGTPIASLASLISLRFYARSKGARLGRYLGAFSAYNFMILAALMLFALLLLR